MGGWVGEWVSVCKGVGQVCLALTRCSTHSPLFRYRGMRRVGVVRAT